MKMVRVVDARLQLAAVLNRVGNEASASRLRLKNNSAEAYIVRKHEAEIIATLEELKEAIKAFNPSYLAEQAKEEAQMPVIMPYVDLRCFEHSQRLSGEVLIGMITRLSPDPLEGEVRVGAEYYDGMGDRENDSFVRPLFMRFSTAIKAVRLTRYQLAAAVERGVVSGEEAALAVLIINS
ncbi:MAG: hypothetical protein WCO21_02845 [bacterium]